MIKQIKKVGVIGAGTMGAGIAGQVANAGTEVWLLDLPSDGENVNSLSAKGLERLKDPDMPGLMSVEAEKLIRLGNTRDDFHQLEDCDWVAEAVVEKLDIKQALYLQLNDIFIIPNCMDSHGAGERLFLGINSVIKTFLGSSVSNLGTIRSDEMVLRAIKSSKPLLTFAPSSAATRDFSALAKTVIKLPCDTTMSGGLQFFFERLALQKTVNN